MLFKSALCSPIAPKSRGPAKQVALPARGIVAQGGECAHAEIFRLGFAPGDVLIWRAGADPCSLGSASSRRDLWELTSDLSRLAKLPAAGKSAHAKSLPKVRPFGRSQTLKSDRLRQPADCTQEPRTYETGPRYSLSRPIPERQPHIVNWDGACCDRRREASDTSTISAYSESGLSKLANHSSG